MAPSWRGAFGTGNVADRAEVCRPMTWYRGYVSIVGVVGVLVFAGAAASQCGPVSGGGGSTTTTAITSPTTTTMPTSDTTTTTIKSGSPIGPEQHYLGLVNGKNAKATIMVVCPGPAAGGTGSPAGNQTVAVTQVATGGGNTGSMGHEVWTQFGADRFHVVAFANYDTPATIPTTLQLPCEGTGLVDFTTCFGTLPCAVDSVDNIVTVTFVNIAA
jgi:hypothetical protein